MRARLLASLVTLGTSLAFLAPQRAHQSSLNAKGFGKATEKTTTNPVDELSDERKANLFQCLLRDLQVEGVPLLAVDTNQQVSIVQAALWTTLAELPDRVCLVLEDEPVSTLRDVVDSFEQLQSKLPDLERFKVSLVGQGVGPALLLETTNQTVVVPPDSTLSEQACRTALESFADRVSLVDDMMIRVCSLGEAYHVLSAVWNAVCERQVTPGTTLLALPAVQDLD